MDQLWWLPAIALIVLVVAGYLWGTRGKASRSARLVLAKRRFHTQRERLEAKFIQLAAAHAKSTAPRWTDCAFADDVSYVRNRTTGELCAFVAVAIATEELEDSPLHGTADAVGNLQAGTAVFRFDLDHWETDGRAILNLSPNEAAHHFRNDLEIVGEELAHRQV